MRTLAIGALCAATFISSAALAQTSTMPNSNATTSPTASSMSAASMSGSWRASKFAGVDVYNNANEKIGDINDIILDQSGKVTGVVIGVGGFLGMGEHDVLVSFNDLKFVDEPMRTASGTVAPNTAANRNAANSGTVGAPATAPAPATGAANTTARTTRNWYPDHAILNANKDQLKAMPEFKYN
jgi:sporulation protein YlmC with PRC-barrel domain